MEGREIHGRCGKSGSRRSKRVQTCMLLLAHNENVMEIEEIEMKR